MFTLKIRNKYYQTLNLTGTDSYDISSIDGLSPMDATVNTTKNAGEDGSTFNSSYNNERQIIITVAINNPAEINRRNLYKYLQTKEKVRVYYSNDSLNVYIDGYISEITCDYFAEKQIAQISILCPQPFWCDAKTVEQVYDPVVKLFEFPFSIETPIPFSEYDYNLPMEVINDGEVATGAIIKVTAGGHISKFRITNDLTGDYFEVNKRFSTGAEILIDTNIGSKSVTSGGNNLIGYVADGSKWLQLRPGSNQFSIKTGDGESDCDMTFTVVNKYQGV